jgi:hypothetical protein
MEEYTYPRESAEYVFFQDISLDGQPAVLPLQFSLTLGLDRPLIWKDLTVVNGKFAFFLDGTLPPGDYKVWVRVPGAPETAVIQAGKIRIS